MLKQLFYLAFMICFALSACNIFHPPDKEAVIVVGDQSIDEAELKKDMTYITSGMGLTDQDTKEILDSLIGKLVDHYLLLAYGRQNNITLSNQELEAEVTAIKQDYPEEEVFQETLRHRYLDYDKWKQGLRRQLLVRKIIAQAAEGITPVTPDEIKTYFDAHPEEFMRKRMASFQQIVTSSMDEAEKLRKRIQEGESLAELAKKHSIAPEAKNGGDVGWVSQGELEETMDKAIFSMKAGEIGPVVETPYGYHIIAVQSERPEGLKTLQEAETEIGVKLILQKQKVLYNNWMVRLRELFPVKINQEILATMEFG